MENLPVKARNQRPRGYKSQWVPVNSMNFHLKVLGVDRFLKEDGLEGVYALKWWTSEYFRKRGTHGYISIYKRLENYEILYYAHKAFRWKMSFCHPDSRSEEEREVYTQVAQYLSLSYNWVKKVIKRRETTGGVYFGRIRKRKR